MTSCNEFTWPPVFTGSCILFKMSFSCRSSPRAFYRFSPRAQSCSEYTMVWKDTSGCLFTHLMRVKRIIRIRFDSLYSYLLHFFSVSRFAYVPRSDTWASTSPIPLTLCLFERYCAAPSETVESRRGKQQKELYQDLYYKTIFWLIGVFKIRNYRSKRLASSPWPLFCALKANWRLRSVAIKRAAKTIMLLENCDDTSATMAEREDI